MKKTLIVLLIISNSIVFAQDNDTISKNTVEITAGKIFSNYRYFKNYTEYENINIAYSYNFSNKTGLFLEQSYARVFSEKTNNRGIVLATNFGLQAKVLKINKFYLQLSAGMGLQQIYLKSLYVSYPFNNNIYGFSINTGASVYYNLNKQLDLSLNIKSYYSYMYFNDSNIFLDPYYNKTLFYSVNIGVRYAI